MESKLDEPNKWSKEKCASVHSLGRRARSANRLPPRPESSSLNFSSHAGRLQSWKQSIRLTIALPPKPGWRNWQTQRTQNPPVLGTLGVQLPLPAPASHRRSIN